MQSQRVLWGGLQSYVVSSVPAGRQPRLAVVLCHGFGAGGSDLVGLAQPLLLAKPALAESVAFVFPAGPLDLTERQMPGSRAWWWIDLERLLYGPTPEIMARFRTDCPPGLPQARDLLSALVDEAGRHFGLPADRFVLGGFSQGAMLATDLALRMPTPPAALCVLSGALINEPEWRRLAAARGSLTVLQSHGKQDSILPFPTAAALRDLFLESGAQLDFLAFQGDHEIPLHVVQRMSALCERLVQG